MHTLPLILFRSTILTPNIFCFAGLDAVFIQFSFELEAISLSSFPQSFGFLKEKKKEFEKEIAKYKSMTKAMLERRKDTEKYKLLGNDLIPK
jgi:hypothetical protein